MSDIRADFGFGAKPKYEDFTAAGRRRRVAPQMPTVRPLISPVGRSGVGGVSAPSAGGSTPPAAPEGRSGRVLPTGTPLVPVSGVQPSLEDFAEGWRGAGRFAKDVLFGPEVGSVLPWKEGGRAGYLERFARTQAGEQEFRVAVDRFSEGRLGAGAGWSALGLAGLVPFVGDVAQGAAATGRAAGALGDAVRGAGAAGDVARSAGATASSRPQPLGEPPRLPTPEEVESLRISRQKIADEELARTQRAESADFKKQQEALRRKQMLEYQRDQEIARKPVGPPRIDPSGVEALRPLTPPSWKTDPIGGATQVLGEQGLIRPTLKNFSDELVDDALRAFRDSGVSPEVIQNAARGIARTTPAVFYAGNGVEYGAKAARQANSLAKVRLLKLVGDQIQATPAPGYRIDADLNQVAARFNDLEPAIAMDIEALKGVLDAGRMRTASEIGQSKSLGLLPWWQRFSDIEKPKFGVQEGYRTTPVYGLLVGKRGSVSQPWETQIANRSTTARGRTITSEQASGAYGNIVLRFNDEVRNNTSFVFGDSILGGRIENSLPTGIGRPLNGTTPSDVAMSGFQRAGTSPYIEAQIWSPPNIEQIASISAPSQHYDEIRALLGDKGLDVPIYDSSTGELISGPTPNVARGSEVGKFGLQVSPLKVSSDRAKYTGKLTDLTDVVYREMPFDEFRIIKSDSGFGLGGRQIWVSNSPDLALGQGPWPKVLVEYDASVFGDVRPGNKPGWQFSWDSGSAEFLVRPDEYSGLREIDAVKSLIIPNETIPTIKQWQLQSLSKDFAREKIEGGIKFTRKPPTPNVARGR